MEQNDSLAKGKDEYFRIEDLPPIGVRKCIFSDRTGFEFLLLRALFLLVDRQCFSTKPRLKKFQVFKFCRFSKFFNFETTFFYCNFRNFNSDFSQFFLEWN